MENKSLSYLMTAVAADNAMHKKVTNKVSTEELFSRYTIFESFLIKVTEDVERMEGICCNNGIDYESLARYVFDFCETMLEPEMWEVV